MVMMAGAVVIREYTVQDAAEVGWLIADTYAEFNLAFADPDELPLFLGPFRDAYSPEEAHQKAIVQILQSPMCYVAEVNGQIAGVLRGRRERLASLFVHKAYHRQGIARRLVERFEADSAAAGVRVIRLAATLYAVPFYLKVGYKRSTGVRTGRSFEGYGLPIQPMKKVIQSRPAGT